MRVERTVIVRRRLGGDRVAQDVDWSRRPRPTPRPRDWCGGGAGASLETVFLELVGTDTGRAAGLHWLAG